jgi:transcriptional regulator with XRE-family HTH domain
MSRLRVKEVMEEKGVSMGMLSRGANIPINTVRKLVRNTPGYSPTMNTLLRVAAYLGVTLNDLYTEDEAPDSK